MYLAKRSNYWYNYLLFSALFLIYSPLYASFEDLVNSARAAAMGEAFVGLANSSQAILINPAGLAELKSLEFSSFYYRPFGIKELTYTSIAITHPFQHFVPGLAIQQYGYSNYHETSLNLTLAKISRQTFSYGATFRLLHLNIKNYGSMSTFGIDLGLIIHANEKTSFGFVIKNINQPQIGKIKEGVPPILISGVCLKPVNSLNLTCDIYKHFDFPVELRTGLEYKLSNFLILRSGVSSEPSRFSLGLGLLFRSIITDYAFISHPTLGFTHLFSISFSISKPWNSLSRSKHETKTIHRRNNRLNYQEIKTTREIQNLMSR